MELLAGLFGLVFGSFLNVCIYRLPVGKSIVWPPSHCPICGKKLKWHDLIPVLSFVLLRGQCRFCKSRISIMYPVVEILSAAGAYLSFKVFGLTLEAVLLYLFYMVLLNIGAVDIRTKEISTISIILLGILKIGFVAVQTLSEGKHMSISGMVFVLSGGILNSAFVALIWLLSKGKAMGFGDVLLLIAGGFGFDWKEMVVCNLLSFAVGALWSVVYLIKHGCGKSSFKSEIPFAPFICFALFITTIWGKWLADLYINLVWRG
jgi:leader peptidase (prepilin peptidase)/N-methyltransferase